MIRQQAGRGGNDEGDREKGQRESETMTEMHFRGCSLGLLSQC